MPDRQMQKSQRVGWAFQMFNLFLELEQAAEPWVVAGAIHFVCD